MILAEDYVPVRFWAGALCLEDVPHGLGAGFENQISQGITGSTPVSSASSNEAGKFDLLLNNNLNDKQK